MIKTGGTRTSIILDDKSIAMNLDVKMLVGLAMYVVSFLLYVWIVKNQNLSYIVPLSAGILNVISIVLGIAFLREKISLSGIVGVAFIGIGIILMNVRK